MSQKVVKRVNHEFWVTNIARDRDVALGDLRVTVRAGKSINLLDSRHYCFNLDQLRLSAESGSIKKKSRFIKVRDLPPVNPIQPGVYAAKTIGPQTRLVQKLPTSVKIEYKRYEELGDLLPELREAEEKFATEDADMAIADYAPNLAVDNIYKKPLEKK